MDVKQKLQDLFTVSTVKKVDWRLTLVLALFGAGLVILPLWATFNDWRTEAHSDAAFAEGQAAVDQVYRDVEAINRVLDNEEIRTLALAAHEAGGQNESLLSALQSQLPSVTDVSVFAFDQVALLSPADLGPSGFAVLDLLLTVSEGKPGLLQFHQSAEPPSLFIAAPAGSEANDEIIILVRLDPAHVTSGFQPQFENLGYVRLAQYNGRQRPNTLKEFGNASLMGEVPDRIPINRSMFRVEFPQVIQVDRLSFGMLLLLLAAGFACLGGAWVLNQRNRNWLVEAARKEEEEQRARVKIVRRSASDEAEPPAPAESVIPDQSVEIQEAIGQPGPAAEPADEEGSADSGDRSLLQTDPPPMRLQYNLQDRKREKPMQNEPVELLPEIFRAYDIRGIVGKTLDEGIANKVGKAVGSVAMEKAAGPVVVARDGRDSGPGLMEGMIEGILSTGCDVIDIGAVPTGVLYYAAHEFGNGSGVMITGSHNPPDYNGFKVMIGGNPLHGDAVTGLYDRIRSGDIRLGQGNVSQRDAVPDYIERIASDIKVERPLKVVIDCGNGIGGVCAAETLRALGVEALPLFDEVDGTFPNHHPDPSEPENLQDLIEAVRFMDADLGLALDGDADRLGVVTLGGDIIYPDRVMMLLALDVLDRVPGATIIYDVKCTGHLPKVIEEAGGKAVMYKTGHSLIKAYMKEIDSPFAGEMSGHFFFGERWYGVDDGIYAAARLLEILGGTETPPEAILGALPTSFSTPELKVQMSEGENHAFIETFREKARFEYARINTIDGLRADFEDGWGLVRASNTTPILVVRFDGETEEALNRIKAVFRSQMLEINPDLDLPF